MVIGGEDAVGEEIVAHELPKVFDRVQLGRFWRQRQEGDVLRDLEALGHVPSGLIMRMACLPGAIAAAISTR